MSNVSMVVDCLGEMSNFTFVRKATINECRFSKSAGLIFLLITIISLIINTHALFTIRNRRQISFRDLNLICSMFISLLCVIIISVLSVVIQCFLCRRLCSTVICQIEGFNSFLNGCITMYILFALSIIRYTSTANASSRCIQQLLKKCNRFLMIICFILGSIWAVPPIFGRVNAYVPEGLGFHCDLNWFDRSFGSRIYFFLLFIAVYLIPIVSLEMTDEQFLRKHTFDTSSNRATQRLQRLYEDRRFVLARSISLIVYPIAWTPYRIIALARVFGEGFSLNNPWLMTTCALLAKLSIIINPIIYTTILRSREVQ